MPIYSGSGSSTNPTNVNPPYDFTEDSPHSSGAAGAFVLAVRNDAGTALAADGDYIPFTTDSSGSLRVAASVAINYAYPEDSVHVSGDIGSFILAVRNQSNTVLTTADGDYSPIAVDQFGRIRTNNAFDYNEDSDHTSGDIGSFILAVRNDVAGSLVDANGDYAPLQVDSAGALRVAASVAINYAYSEDTAHVSGDIGSFSLGVRNDAAATFTSADGDYSPFATDAAGRIGISDLGGTISIDDGAGSITVDGTVSISGTVTVDTSYNYSEDSPHTSGNMGAFTLGVRNDGASAFTSTDGDYSPFAVDSAGRIGITTLGNTLTTDDIKTEDAPHSTGATGSFILAVRNDANVALTSTDLDYSPIAVDSDGAVQISDGGNSVTVDGTVSVTQGTSPWVIGDGGGSITVDGTVTVDTNFDFAEDSVHVSGDIGSFVLAVRNDAGTALAADGDYIPFTTDSSGALRVAASIAINYSYAEDSAHVSGDFGAFTLGVRNDAGAALTSADGDYSPFATDSAGRIGISDLGGSISIDDNAGSITVDGTVEIGATSLAALESITVQNGSGAAAVNIQDGGNSITVDGTVAISGTVTVDTNYDFAEDATHNSGDIGVQVLAVRNDTPGTLVSANGDYASFQQDGSGGLRVAGTIAHDTAIVTATHSPILTASRAQDDNTTITSVAAGDVTFNLTDLKGVQFMKEQRPQLLGIYYGIFGPNQLTNAADGATVGRMWLVNTSSAIAAAVRSISFEAVLASTTAMLTFPRITVERMTFTGTPTGATITPAFRASTDATNTATIRTASTGMTITAGAGIHNFIPPLSLTGVGTISIPEQKLDLLDHSDGRIILGQNQGIVIRQADGGTANDNRRFFISIAWEEYTV